MLGDIATRVLPELGMDWADINSVQSSNIRVLRQLGVNHLTSCAIQ